MTGTEIREILLRLVEIGSEEELRELAETLAGLLKETKAGQ